MERRQKSERSFKRSKKPSNYRRIVTGNVNGRSVVQTDEQMEAYQFKTVPGYEHTLIWLNAATPDLSKSKGLTAIPTLSFRDPAAPVCTS